jgi:hypothetical protein
VRLARWTAAVLPVTALGVAVIGPRVDVLSAISEPAFLAVGAATLGTALLSGAGAFVLSIPGVERSPLPRALPLAAAGVWALLLIVSLTAGIDPVERVLALPLHLACLIEIAALSIVPGWALFAMVRRAAPLRRAWSAGLATLAAVALAAVATQVICPVDDPAHQLVGHVLPVLLLAACGAIVGRGWLNWPTAARFAGHEK